jgi:hypothetical protein
MDTLYNHDYVKHIFFSLSPLQVFDIQDRTLLLNMRSTNREIHAITYAQATTHYIITKQGRAPKKYTGRRATHKYCTQIKHKKIFYYHI